MKLMQPHKVVLFDHDGTIVDSEIVALKSAWQLTTEVTTALPGAQLYDLPEFIQSFAGKPYREILTQIYVGAPTALNEPEIEKLVAEEEDRAIEHLKLEAKATAGTPEVLSYLRNSEFRFALVSNSSLRRLNACLTASALTSYFPPHLVFSAHDSLPIRRPKPLPDIYLHAASKLGTSVSNCLAVEDSVSGVQSAVMAGISQVIGYVGGTHISENERSSRALALRSMGAHRIIERMSDLIELLSHETECAVG
ncbi:MAG: HAD family phosphatase [Timaviella obliquedivisa GSE-PSE-MK23-08B]|jgi:beta-phosphoglucomutase-like phosphatase (HAD superfamily)|nr:HAD family phosphatase [Timaviella obliquedivisa GSE-PSE-MK23-08B]